MTENPSGLREQILRQERDRLQRRQRRRQRDTHDALLRELADTREARERAEHDARHAQAELAVLRASSSWRLTAPLRALLARLRSRANNSLSREPVGVRVQAERTEATPPPTSPPNADLPDASDRCGAAAEPELSILLISRDAAEATLDALHHLLAHTQEVTYEILIAECTDAHDQPSALQRFADDVPGVSLILLPSDRSRGEAFNILAERARGRALCLMNIDLRVGPRWLAPLRALPSAGMVGAVATPDTAPAHRVDTLIADLLLLDRSLFLALGGFDLAYEPEFCEDADLCRKLASSGHQLWLHPGLDAQRIGAQATDTPAQALLRVWNAEKLAARWPPGRVATRRPSSRPRAMIFTPYALTLGGGERYLLTAAMALAQDHDVVIVTPQRYSHLRLDALAEAFALDLSACALATQAEIPGLAPFDRMLAIGTHLAPPIATCGRTSLYVCQFPFEMAEPERTRLPLLAGYGAVIAYSDYARHHILRGLGDLGLAPPPIHVVYPPVPSMAGDARRKRASILSVGRFTAGGHDKRHDRLIELFRTLNERNPSAAELHLAGGLLANPPNMAHMERLRALADGLPVTFHVDCSAAELSGLFRDASVYWHATGFEADLDRHPELAEHFGISLVEAMSAECVPIAFDAGGPAEIVESGRNGFLYTTADELLARTTEMLDPAAAPTRQSLATAARCRAADFSETRFLQSFRQACGLQAAGQLVAAEGFEPPTKGL